MLQTRADDRLAIIPLRTRFYSKDKSGAVVNAEFLDSSYKAPGGGWLSSAPDMARFEVAILQDRLIRSATRELMWTQLMPADGLGRMAYGLGWQFGFTDNVRDIGHGGSQQGTSAAILIAPDARAGVVVLTNSDGNDASGLASRLLRIVLGLPDREHKELVVDPMLYSRYTGSYQVGDFIMTITREGGRLFAGIKDRKIPLSPESARDFVFQGSDTQIIFEGASTGQAKELILRENGADAYLNRIK